MARVAVHLSEGDLAAVLHAIEQTPWLERPSEALTRRLLAAYGRAGGDRAYYDHLVSREDDPDAR